MKACSLALLLLLLAGLVHAQTEVLGEQSGTWSSAGSPYQVIGDITVPSGQALLIEAGVDVVFQGHYRFEVNGELQALGAEADSVSFWADNPVLGWGGIRFVGADPSSRLSFCSIRHGKATGDWPDNCGGGVSLWESDVDIEHCYLTENSASNLGGGFFCWGSESHISDTIFRDNFCSYDGGAIYFYFSSGTISRCEVVDNSCSYYGAALALQDGYPEISYTLFANNHAGGQGGVMYSSWSRSVFNNCTLTENDAMYGGALYMVIGEALCTNSIFWNNSGIGDDIFLDWDGSVEINYCDILGDWGGEGNIAVDPGFVDPVGGDFHLSEGSQCIAPAPTSSFSRATR